MDMTACNNNAIFWIFKHVYIPVTVYFQRTLKWSPLCHWNKWWRCQKPLPAPSLLSSAALLPNWEQKKRILKKVKNLNGKITAQFQHNSNTNTFGPKIITRCSHEQFTRPQNFRTVTGLLRSCSMFQANACTRNKIKRSSFQTLHYMAAKLNSGSQPLPI